MIYGSMSFSISVTQTLCHEIMTRTRLYIKPVCRTLLINIVKSILQSFITCLVVLDIALYTTHTHTTFSQAQAIKPFFPPTDGVTMMRVVTEGWKNLMIDCLKVTISVTAGKTVAGTFSTVAQLFCVDNAQN